VSNEINSLADEQIARAAQGGSMPSFEELVGRYEARIHRFVSHRCRNESDAQEVTQDVFVAAFRGLDRFDPGRSFATWLFTIARRKCIDYSRSRRAMTHEVLPELADDTHPGAQLAQREADADLWRTARAVMSEAQYDALWLRCAEDMELAEIARAMKLTRTHVKVLLFRARLKLERALPAQPRTGMEPGSVSAAPARVLRVAPGGGV
jgi:RNA polymerase sigma-70 factor (ECF subfamily)